MNTIIPQTSDGRKFHLGALLGKGGEGSVYHVTNEPSMAIKLYKPDKADERKDKIAIMVSNKYHEQSSYVVFPIDSLFDANTNRFIGFTMKKVSDVKPIHNLYAPGSRKKEFPDADFRFLTRTALNIARAVASIHSVGCVIGDINQSGIMVSSRATVTLIDSDSFQIYLGKLTYRCPVGVPDYTPPELQGIDLATVDRTPNHDTFGLAVMLFLLLFMGWHPFTGRYLRAGEMPIDKAIREGRFAYSRRNVDMKPPPLAPMLTEVPKDIADAFEKAFQPPVDSDPRPSAVQWVMLLERMEKELIVCHKAPGHHYSEELHSCPWCRLERLRGTNLFTPSTHVAVVQITDHTILHPTDFDISMLLTAIHQIKKPQVAPDVLSVLPAFTPNKRSPIVQRARNLKNMRIAAILFFTIGLLLALIEL